MDGWLDGWMDGWMEGVREGGARVWMDGRAHVLISGFTAGGRVHGREGGIYLCTYVCAKALKQPGRAFTGILVPDKAVKELKFGFRVLHYWILPLIALTKRHTFGRIHAAW